MNDNFKDLLADNGEVILDTLIANEILKEIPILGTSLKLIKGIQNIRDQSYLNKIKHFIDHLGEINESKRKKLIEESNKSKKNRVKFGDALFTTIEQSDSLMKIEYLAVAFEAFLSDELHESDFRHLCHIIKNTFTDELSNIIESDNIQSDLKYSVQSGLVDVKYLELKVSTTNIEPEYNLSIFAQQLRRAWNKYKKSN